MNAPPALLTGIVEGFYGRLWSHQTRLAYATYLVDYGLNTCLYCPKGDPYLRKRWQQHWPGQEWRQLLALSATYRAAHLNWGVGLSPFALYRDYGPAQRQQLRHKLECLGELEAPLLAILFDDMPGDVPDLASRQAEIVADVCAWQPAARVLVCPTYYSFDPVLERHFGPMPADYWPRLGRDLPASVDVFWTGNRVCAESIEAGDIEAINRELGRRVILWDNYPVNDGALRSNFLYCDSLPQRDRALAPLIRGHLCNPMNQGLLSLPALAGLARLYGVGEPDEQWLAQLLGSATWKQLQQDRADFQTLGLAGMGAARCRELASRYDALPDAAAREVASWLRGEYTFDPACLTD